MPRKRQSTKSRIVKAAWNLFYKNGYDKTTIEEIIAASKTSKGTFYHYFKSKEGLLYMIETSIDVKLIAYLYSAQLVTKDKRSLSDHKRFYFSWLTQIMQEGLDSGEFADASTAEELMNIYAMYERALLYDWSLFRGKYSLSEYSGRLLPHVLEQFKEGI